MSSPGLVVSRRRWLARILLLAVILLGLAVITRLAAARDSIGAMSRGALPLTGPVTVALLPLGGIDDSFVAEARAGIEAEYGFAVRILPRHPMPLMAYYPPRNRYRAPKLLDFLHDLRPPDAARIVGLTDHDISTPTGEYPDWGIFGLARLPGYEAVVSTFRLRHGDAGPAVVGQRLRRCVVHELGHTLGLPHCADLSCLMQAAEGKISTVDAAARMCAHCREALRAQGG